MAFPLALVISLERWDISLLKGGGLFSEGKERKQIASACSKAKSGRRYGCSLTPARAEASIQT